MSNNNEERTFIRFEIDDTDKEFFKKYVKDKRMTMSDFTRKAIWFFIDRDTTPDKYLVKNVERDQTPIDIDLSKIDTLIKRLDERDMKLKESLDSIDRAIKGAKIEIVTDVFDRIAHLTEEIDNLKRGV